MKFYVGSGFKNSDLVNQISEKLVKSGWEHTYNWTKAIKEKETLEDLVEVSILEQNAIKESDVVIILLPAGRGTHVEIGMALALDKEIYLCSKEEETFSVEDTVNFYYHPKVKRIVGDIEKIVQEISQTKN